MRAKRMRRCIITAAAVIAGAACVPATGLAAVSSWGGSPGVTDGQIKMAGALAQMPGGDLLIADVPNTARIQRFGANGAFKSVFARPSVVYSIVPVSDGVWVSGDQLRKYDLSGGLLYETPFVAAEAMALGPNGHL